MAPADLVLVEGYKRAPHRKIEVYRAAVGGPTLAAEIASIRALAGDPGPAGLPVFDLADIPGIAAFVMQDALSLADTFR
ncbi:MAG: molybdopterin-guanine dinucleotide biosynthesis protein MobB [Pseudomonadota bacterium]